MKILRRLGLLIAVALFSACGNLSNSYNPLQHLCRAESWKGFEGRTIFRLTGPDGVAISREQIGKMEIHEAGSAPRSLSLTPGGCFVLPSRKGGVFRATIPKRELGISAVLKEMSPNEITTLTLLPVVLPVPLLTCPKRLRVQRGEDFINQLDPAEIPVRAGNQISLQFRSETFEQAWIWEEYSENPRAFVQAQDLPRLPDGKYATTLHVRDLLGRSADSPPCLVDVDSSLPPAPIYKSGSLVAAENPLDVEFAAGTQLYFCRERKEEAGVCGSRKNFSPLSGSVKVSEQGAWRLFFFAEKESGAQSSITFWDVVVDAEPPTLTLAWKNLRAVGAVTVLETTSKPLVGTVAVSDALTRSAELLEKLQCRVEVGSDFQDDRSTQEAVCLREPCEGMVLDEFKNCGNQVVFEFADESRVLDKRVTLFFRTEDGAGHRVEKSVSAWILRDALREWNVFEETPGPLLKDQFVRFFDFLPLRKIVQADGQEVVDEKSWGGMALGTMKGVFASQWRSSASGSFSDVGIRFENGTAIMVTALGSVFSGENLGSVSIFRGFNPSSHTWDTMGLGRGGEGEAIVGFVDTGKDSAIVIKKDGTRLGLDDGEGEWRPLASVESLGLLANVKRDREGTTWAVSAGKTLVRFRSDGTFETFVPGDKAIRDYVLDADPEEKRRLFWLATEEKISLYDATEGAAIEKTTVPLSGEISGENFRLGLDSHRDLLALRGNSFSAVERWREGLWTSDLAPGLGTTAAPNVGNVITLANNRRGKLWVGGSKGVARYDGCQWSMFGSTVLGFQGEAQSLGGGTLRPLFPRQLKSSLFVALSTGALRYFQNDHWVTLPGLGSPLSDAFEDSSGKLHVLSKEGQLFVLKPKGNGFEWEGGASRPAFGGGDSCTVERCTLAETGDHRLVVQRRDQSRGLGSDGQWHPLNLPAPGKLFLDAKGGEWIAGENGLWGRPSGSVEWQRVWEGRARDVKISLREKGIFALFANGEVVFVPSGGLPRLVTSPLPPPFLAANTLAEAANGDLWVAAGGALAQWNDKERKWRHHAASVNDFPFEENVSVVAQPSGEVWATGETEKGPAVALFNPYCVPRF